MINYYGNEIQWVPSLKKEKKPKFILIAESIEEDIQSGKLLHGAKLPPQRVIAGYLGINHGTVTRAYKLCEERGLLKGIIGKGTFVSGSAGLPVELLSGQEDSDIINLGMALPVYEVNEFIEEKIKEVLPSIDYSIALKYCPPEGHISHRYIACNWLENFRVKTTPENIIISAGSQNALAVIMITMFSKSDRIIVDEFTYTGLKALAKYLGIILIPVRGSEKGIDTDELYHVCKRENAKGIYLIPDCHNPTSIVLAEEKRDIIASIIKEFNLLLIEDGSAKFTVEANYKPISVRVPQQSFYIHGTSKVISPTLRISYLVAPDKYIKKLRQGINNLTWMASPYTSEIMSKLQSTGKYKEISDKKLNLLKERNQVFDKIFEAYIFRPSISSLFRYLVLPEGVNESDIEQLALQAGVQVFNVNRFITGVEKQCNAIRVSVSSPKNIQELTEGLIKIRDIFENNHIDFTPIV